MDPSALATATAAAAAAPDLGQVVAAVAALLALVTGRWWVAPAVRIAAAWVFGARAAGVKVERAPDPVSDGGTAADRELPPAQPAPPRSASLDEQGRDAG